MMWQATDDGYFFPRSDDLSAAVESKLQTLILEDSAQISAGGTLIPFEKSFLLSEEDAELLNLPPLNPYRISIRTEGYIGGKNFHYVVDLLKPDGRSVIKPQINGALVHVDEEIFRLNANQFALIDLAKFGNENISSEEPLLIVKRIQQQAAKSDAQIDGYISEKNKKIIVPDKLDVDFQESGDTVKVAPILLENHDGKLEKIDSADFQGVFSNRKKILSSYRGKDGAQYVFSNTLRDGLAQIKSVGTLSKSDAIRYKLQPRELFTSEAFDFDYSDRVIGIEEIEIVAHRNPSWEIDWGEGRNCPEISKPNNSKERSKVLALKIKENTESNIYKKDSVTRQGKFFADVLCPGVTLYDYQVQGIWKISQVWQEGYHGILVADDMGLGKTLQTLIFIGGLKKFCAAAFSVK